MLLINNMLKRPWMCAVKCDAFQTLSVTNEKNFNLKCVADHSLGHLLHNGYTVLKLKCAHKHRALLVLLVLKR